MPNPARTPVTRDLIRFYQTGDSRTGCSSAQPGCKTIPLVDFANGFIEVYRDARGAKGTSQSFVIITDQRTEHADGEAGRQRAVLRRSRAVGATDSRNRA